jgi:hypothetical protein
MGRPGLKVVWAVALALGLFQCALPGSTVIRWGVPPTFWSAYLWPWLSQSAVALTTITVVLVTACRLRAQRPERLAARLAAVVSFLALPMYLAMPLVRGVPHGAGPYSSLYFAQVFVLQLFRFSWAFLLPLAVSCWVGARYWRADNWAAFWRGPGGAILKGGLVAGGVGVALSFAGASYSWSHTAEFAAKAGLRVPFLLTYHWWLQLLTSLPAITQGAVITALLASWRPNLVLGAFAGSGLSAGVTVLSFIGLLASYVPIRSVSSHDLLGLGSVWTMFPQAVLLGAIAGVFAGRWEEEKGA